MILIIKRSNIFNSQQNNFLEFKLVEKRRLCSFVGKLAILSKYSDLEVDNCAVLQGKCL